MLDAEAEQSKHGCNYIALCVARESEAHNSRYVCCRQCQTARFLLLARYVPNVAKEEYNEISVRKKYEY